MIQIYVNAAKVAISSTLLALSFQVPSHAEDQVDELILPIPKSGKLTEYCPQRTTFLAVRDDVLFCRAEVFLTDQNMNDIMASGWPRRADFIRPGGNKSFGIPKKTQLEGTGNEPVFVDVFDVRQILTLRVSNIENDLVPQQQNLDSASEEGPSSDLSIEAIFFDEMASQFVLGNIYGALAERFGSDFPEILIPDMFADTDEDGSLDSGDTLFSVVDLNLYTEGSIFSFDFGDTFDIVDGEVSGLPGMLFSTQPFSFTPEDGLINSDPYTGSGVVLGAHGVSPSVPEPSALVGLITVAGIGMMSRRQLSQH